MLLETNGVYTIDALRGVNGLPDRSVQCCVTSPPYYRQRDYGMAGQWGQEDSPEEFVERLVWLFDAMKRVLRDDGTLWIVIGDSYAGGGRMNGKSPRYDYREVICGEAARPDNGYKRKDLLGVPWMLAFALRKDGWWLRQDIIWLKKNSMPESVQDRCTRAHEYIFMFAKRPHYYYDHLAIATPLSESSIRRMNQDIKNQKGSVRLPGKTNGPMKSAFTDPFHKQDGHGRRRADFNTRWDGRPGTDRPKLANRKSVWSLSTAGSREDHYASFPGGIPSLCIKAGSREGSTILDPFAGTGQTLLQASILGRRYIGFDLNPKYVGIARRRLKNLEGLFYQG